MKPWAKYSIAALTVIVVVLVGVLIWAAADGGTTKVARASAQAEAVRARAESNRWLEAKIRRRQKKNAEAAAVERRARAKAEVEKTGIDGSPGRRPGEATPRGGNGEVSSASFAKVESEIDGEVGVAYAPLGSAEPVELGPLQVGHAWSSFKVPIVVTVMLEQGGALTSGQESLAASAITASDNTAAAALFSELESRTGGGASAAVEHTLDKVLGGATEVATAPPPPGAVSSWGQTEWPLAASTSFYGALACGAFGGATETVLRDMESVIPEQQWGFGQASFPSGTQVAFKAGWGPDGSESGPYLVRQAGIIRSSDGGGFVATIAAQDASGSFESGVSDLDRVADWVAENVPPSGSC